MLPTSIANLESPSSMTEYSNEMLRCGEPYKIRIGFDQKTTANLVKVGFTVADYSAPHFEGFESEESRTA